MNFKRARGALGCYSILFGLAAVSFAGLGPIILGGEATVVVSALSDLHALNSAPDCLPQPAAGCVTWTRREILSVHQYRGRSVSCEVTFTDAGQESTKRCEWLKAGRAVDIATWRGGHPLIRNSATGQVMSTFENPQYLIDQSWLGFGVGGLLTLVCTAPLLWWSSSRLGTLIGKRRSSGRRLQDV